MTKIGAFAAVAGIALLTAACSGGEPEPAASEAPVAETPAETPATVETEAAAPAATVDFASLTGDAAAGKTAFAACASCHSVKPGEIKIGPSLAGIVGKKAGSEEGYNYSAANKDSGITWTDEELFKYLEAPQKVVPGTKMAYPGLKDPQKRADIIAYLKNPA